MQTSLSRRGFLSGLIAAPAVVAVSSIMPVSAAKLIVPSYTVYAGNPIPLMWALPTDGGYLYTDELSDIIVRMMVGAERDERGRFIRVSP